MSRPRGKTGTHHRIRVNEGAFVRIEACPADSCLGVPLFDRGSCFDRKTFVRSLREYVFPLGTRVSLQYEEVRELWLIYTLREGGICLHQCDAEGYLVGGGKVLVPVGSELEIYGL